MEATLWDLHRLEMDVILSRPHARQHCCFSCYNQSCFMYAVKRLVACCMKHVVGDVTSRLRTSFSITDAWNSVTGNSVSSGVEIICFTFSADVLQTRNGRPAANGHGNGISN